MTHEIKTLDAIARPNKVKISFVTPEEFEAMFIRDVGA